MTHISSPLRFRPTGPRHSPRHSPHLGCSPSMHSLSTGSTRRRRPARRRRCSSATRRVRHLPLTTLSRRPRGGAARSCPAAALLATSSLALSALPSQPSLSAAPLLPAAGADGRGGVAQGPRRGRRIVEPRPRRAPLPLGRRPSRGHVPDASETRLGEWALATPEHRIAKIEELVKAPTPPPAAPLSAVR